MSFCSFLCVQSVLYVKTILDFVQNHEKIIFSSSFIVAITHFINTFLMVLGRILSRQSLFLPWMVTQVIFIILDLGVFLSWTFFSMFVEFLATLIFPPVSALILGFLLLNWRAIHKVFKRMGAEKTDHSHQTPVLNARPHTKLLTSSVNS